MNILPCPFCGSDGILNCLSNMYSDVYSVSCSGEFDSDCHGLSSDDYRESKEEAIDAWNKRAVDERSKIINEFYNNCSCLFSEGVELISKEEIYQEIKKSFWNTVKQICEVEENGC